MSQRTLEVHWGKHHRGYVDNLNKQLGKDDKLYGYTMEELIKATYNNGNPLPEFNNAAQVLLSCFKLTSPLTHKLMLGRLVVLRSITMISFGSRWNLVVETCLKRVFLSRLRKISVPSQISEKSSLIQLLLSLVPAGSGSSVRNSTSFHKFYSMTLKMDYLDPPFVFLNFSEEGREKT